MTHLDPGKIALVVILEDLCTTMSVEMHAFALKYVFPRLARVRASAEIAF